MEFSSVVKERQQPLIERYILNPGSAWITDVATIEGEHFEDPLLTSVSINDELKVDFPVGVHRAVGGRHDFPNSGDLLCASLGSCFETTLRMIADRMQIGLQKTRVVATANVDVRGTLMVDRDVPVSFQSMGLKVEVKTNDTINAEVVQKLIRATERSCIILQTMRRGIPVTVAVEIL